MRPLIGTVIALAPTPFAGDTAMAETHSATEARNLALVQSGFEAWRNGSGSPFDLLAE